MHSQHCIIHCATAPQFTHSFSCLVGMWVVSILFFSSVLWKILNIYETRESGIRNPHAPITGINNCQHLTKHFIYTPTQHWIILKQISTIIHKYFCMSLRKVMTLISKSNNLSITCIPWCYHKCSVQIPQRVLLSLTAWPYAYELHRGGNT